MDIKKLAEWIMTNYTEKEIEEYIKIAGAKLEKDREYYKNTADLCEKAEKLEKEGETLQAVLIYETLLEENFLGSRPYDRLAIIYKKLKRKDDVIRVLEKAVVIQENEYNKKAKVWPEIKNYPGHRKKLVKYIEKLEKAKQG